MLIYVRCRINASDAQCQYWKGAVCGLILTGNRFACGKALPCATIDTSAYAVPSASDIYLANNAFEGRAPVDASVCAPARRCEGVEACKTLFQSCHGT